MRKLQRNFQLTNYPSNFQHIFHFLINLCIHDSRQLKRSCNHRGKAYDIQHLISLVSTSPRIVDMPHFSNKMLNLSRHCTNCTFQSSYEYNFSMNFPRLEVVHWRWFDSSQSVICELFKLQSSPFRVVESIHCEKMKRRERFNVIKSIDLQIE